MPASMMSEESGSSPKVIGNSMAMVGIGPMPGSTPISVPSKQPSSAKPRFLSDSAAPKPVARLLKISKSMLPAPPSGQRLRQRIDKHKNGEEPEPDAKRERLRDLHLRPRVGRQHCEQHGGDRETDQVDEITEGEDCYDDEEKWAKLDALDRRAFDRQ